jgi:hypothetical protein
MMRIAKNDLLCLLKKTKRDAVVGGKKIAQVNSTVIMPDVDGLVYTTAIVRDGVSSIARFNCPSETTDGESVFVANIDLLLGALSAHNGLISLDSKDGKLLIQSPSKKTTLVSDPKAKAFPHTNKTVAEWSEDSNQRFGKSLSSITKDTYMMQDGTEIEAKVATVPKKELLDALRSGSVNKQMVEKVLLVNNPNQTMDVVVGNEMKGQTRSSITSNLAEEISTTIGGGFEHILEHCAEEECDLLFFDFTSYGAGIAVVLRTGAPNAPTSVVFQREASNG